MLDLGGTMFNSVATLSRLTALLVLLVCNQSLLADGHRSAAHVSRDQYRHPQQTLSFFGIQPGMTVVELSPGGGWYTEVLAGELSQGSLIAAHFPSASAQGYFVRSRAQYKAKLDTNSELYSKVVLSELNFNKGSQLAAAGSVDMVLTFRNVHNWLKGGNDKKVFQQAFSALKPGGVFGIVEHRAKPDTSLQQMIRSGYVTESWVITAATNAGFELIAKSEINANSADGTLHPSGVWTLPPSLRLGDQDRQKYLTIGESDRMTLKFRKPLSIAD